MEVYVSGNYADHVRDLELQEQGLQHELAPELAPALSQLQQQQQPLGLSRNHHGHGQPQQQQVRLQSDRERDDWERGYGTEYTQHQW